MAIFKDYPDMSTPLSGDFLNQVLEMLLPICKTEMFYDAEDHSNYMGFTGELTLVGKMPIGINANDNDFNQIGKSSGEKTHKLTIAEMPKHVHDVKYGTAQNLGLNSGSSGYKLNYEVGGTQQITAAATGGDNPHNNMPPYEVVAFWKRIS